METVLLVGSYSAAYYPPLDCYVVRGMNGTPICAADDLATAETIMRSLQWEPSKWN